VTGSHLASLTEPDLSHMQALHLLKINLKINSLVDNINKLIHTLARIDVIDWLFRITPVILFTLFAIHTQSIMLTIVANSASSLIRASIKLSIETARSSMVVALAFFALVRLPTSSRRPRSIIKQRQTLLAVSSPCIVLALALTVDHAILVRVVLNAFDWNTPARVAIAQTAASNDRFVQSVVVFLFELLARVQQIVAECVQLGEVNS
jgi:hypothetical protein